MMSIARWDVPKNIWDVLTKKYITEDVGNEKYVLGKFLEYKMVDEKFVNDQITEF